VPISHLKMAKFMSCIFYHERERERKEEEEEKEEK
jgi:hypothetical protein